jgi:hypothetical protein
MLRFSTRDIFWLTMVVALALGWWLDRRTHRPTHKHVTGMITVAGQPLDGGRICFHAATGEFHGAQISGGAFKIDRLPFDDYRIVIENEKVPPYYNENRLFTRFEQRTKSIQFGLHDTEHLARILARTSATSPTPQ